MPTNPKEVEKATSWETKNTFVVFSFFTKSIPPSRAMYSPESEEGAATGGGGAESAIARFERMSSIESLGGVGDGEEGGDDIVVVRFQS